MFCRKGPLPQKYLKCTDYYCLIAFVIYTIFLIVIICINWSYSANFDDVEYQNKHNVAITLYYHSGEYILTGLIILVTAFMITILAVVLPNFMGFIAIFCMQFGFIFVAFQQFQLYLKSDELTYFILSLGCIIGLIISIVIIVSRKQKISYFRLFLTMASVAVGKNIISLFSIMIAFSFT